MNFSKFLLSLLAIGFTCSAALASRLDKEVIFTVDQPFVIPGALYTHHKAFVPAGNYHVRFLENASPQIIAYFFAADNSHLIATAIPSRYGYVYGRYTDIDYDKLIEFKQSPLETGMFELYRWTFPGENGGWEFHAENSGQ